MKRYEPLGDARPAPALDDGAPCSFPQLGSLGPVELEQAAQLLGQVGGVPVRERDELPVGGRKGGRGAPPSPRGAGMSADGGGAAGGGPLGGDHPEGLRESRREEGDGGPREQGGEGAMPQRPREE